MHENIEVEFKQLVNQEQFNNLIKLYPNAVFIKQVNTYYDTAAYDLRKNNIALRIREKNNKYIVTCKLPNDKGVKELEWECSENSADALMSAELLAIFTKLGITAKLEAKGSMTTNRATIVLAKAELCLDHNYYNGKEDFEVEYEQTQDHDGLKVFLKLLEEANISYTNSAVSKIKRTLEC